MKEVQDAARAHTALAIDTLAEIAKNKEMSAGARVSAAEVLLDRGWGKAQQKVEVEGMGQLPDHVIEAILSALDTIEAGGDVSRGPSADEGRTGSNAGKSTH